MKFYFCNGLIFIWDIFLILGSAYLINRENWQPLTMLLAIIMLEGFKSEKDIKGEENNEEND